MFALRPIIGVVGGIGSGKSHVARLLGEAGCRVVDSDELVRIAYTHPAVRRAVVQRFGPEFLEERGEVDRPALARRVFSDTGGGDRGFLEELLHPVVNKARVEVMDEAARDEGVRAYVWDSPLLIETGLDRLCDVVVFVDTPDADRVTRVSGRGWAVDELHRREKAQAPLDTKRHRADYVLANGVAQPAAAADASALLTLILARFAPEAGCGSSGGCCGGAGGNGAGDGGGACACRVPATAPA